MQKARRHPLAGAPTACKHTVSGALSLRSSRCLSSFSRLTGSLSVVKECSALESGLPMFDPGFTSPNLLEGMASIRLQGFHLLWPGIPSGSLVPLVYPRSLAATDGVAFAFLS